MLSTGNGVPDKGDAAPLLQVEGVTLQYKTRDHLVTATWRVSFDVYSGDRFVVLGPSGCGKSTILKAIGGFIRPVEGEIRLRGKPVTEPGPDRMMVFQEFDQLFPWKTVKQNVIFSLNGAGRYPRREAEERALLYIEKVNLSRLCGRLSAYAVRRHEAARGDRQGACRSARYSADGRTLRRARCADAPQDAG